jgi:NDP-sugar pyrophosphorylase family protein
MLLGSYHFGRPPGVYWTPSPIFLHAEPCERFERADIVPEIVRHRLVSVRAYDADDMCIYDVGDVCDGTDVERLLDRALADRRTDYVNIHTARPGCFLCRVERV